MKNFIIGGVATISLVIGMGTALSGPKVVLPTVTGLQVLVDLCPPKDKDKEKNKEKNKDKDKDKEKDKEKKCKKHGVSND